MTILQNVSFVNKRSLMGYDFNKQLIVTSPIKKFNTINGVIIAESQNGSQFEVKSFDLMTQKELFAIKTYMIKKKKSRMQKFLQAVVNELPDILIATNGYFCENEAILTLNTGEEIYSNEIVSYDCEERVLTIINKENERKIFLSQGVWAF